MLFCSTYRYGYGFLPFAKNITKITVKNKNIVKNIGKNVSKNLRGKYSQTLLDYAKNSATDAFATPSKRVIPKTAETTGNLTDNKMANRNYRNISNRIIQK